MKRISAIFLMIAMFSLLPMLGFGNPTNPVTEETIPPDVHAVQAIELPAECFPLNILVNCTQGSHLLPVVANGTTEYPDPGLGTIMSVTINDVTVNRGETGDVDIPLCGTTTIITVKPNGEIIIVVNKK